MISPLFRLLIHATLSMALLGVGVAQADPPGRVARLAMVEGSVLVYSPALEQWEEASVNWPLTSDNTLHVGTDGRAELRIGSGVVRVDRGSEVHIVQLDDERIDLRLEHGSVAVSLRSSDPADRITVETADGLAQPGEPGRYRIDASAAATTLAVDRGYLEFIASDTRLEVAEGQRMVVWFDDMTRYTYANALHDDFSAWVDARERDDDARAAPRYVSSEMTGAEDLAMYGDWHEAASYGPVWYPRHVPSEWAPYRDGRWVWVEPWGWTWVDDAPWGFAPFHYGRWVLIGSRWAWVPGGHAARPVYAPALVGWMGSPGWNVTFSYGSAPAFGWFPLGPHDVFIPTYRASPHYVERCNIHHVRDRARIRRYHSNPHRSKFAYRDHERAVTIVPRDTIIRSLKVRPSVLRDPQRWMRDVPVATALPTLERHTPDAQIRARTRHIEEQRQVRSDTSRMLRQGPADSPAAIPRGAPVAIPRAQTEHERAQTILRPAPSHRQAPAAEPTPTRRADPAPQLRARTTPPQLLQPAPQAPQALPERRQILERRPVLVRPQQPEPRQIRESAPRPSNRQIQSRSEPTQPAVRMRSIEAPAMRSSQQPMTRPPAQVTPRQSAAPRILAPAPPQTPVQPRIAPAARSSPPGMPPTEPRGGIFRRNVPIN